MSNIRVRARITLLPSEESGRILPVVRGSYRPNHNFGAADSREMDVGFVEFADDESLHPGETIEREITFWSRPGLNEVLVPGRAWRIQEGARLVGIGTVLEILNESA
jgi:translation elongation factor EF-Tu-like GTPase